MHHVHAQFASVWLLISISEVCKSFRSVLLTLTSICIAALSHQTAFTGCTEYYQVRFTTPVGVSVGLSSTMQVSSAHHMQVTPAQI